MRPEVDRAMKELLRLPAGELGEAIVRLLASLDGEPDENAEAEWEEEIKRRVEDLSSGRVQPVPLAEACNRTSRTGFSPRRRHASEA